VGSVNNEELVQELRAVLQELVQDLNGENSEEQLGGYLNWLGDAYNHKLEEVGVEARLVRVGTEED
jgi:hypothetical protein